MKRDVSSTSIIKSSGSMRKKNNQDGYVEDSVTPCTSSRNSKRKSWLRNCTGKSNSSSEDSSEAVAMNLDDTSLSSSHFALSGSRRRNISPPCTPMPTNFVSTKLQIITTECPDYYFFFFLIFKV